MVGCNGFTVSCNIFKIPLISVIFNNAKFSYRQLSLHSSVNFRVALAAITGQGCIDSITKVILMEKGVILYAPNSFTPDGNQHNPVFLPIVTSGVDKNQHELEVFNPWGEVVSRQQKAKKVGTLPIKELLVKKECIVIDYVQDFIR